MKTWAPALSASFRTLRALLIVAFRSCTSMVPNLPGNTSSAASELTTTGVVTAIAFNGYYVQDPIGDGNDDTSDGMFVFKFGSKPNVGDLVQLTDTVTEFIPGGAATGNLSITQMSFPTLVPMGSSPLPARWLLDPAAVSRRTCT